MIQNMKGCIKKISTLLMCFICTNICAQNLNIQINKIKNNRGSILVSIYNDEKGFPYQSTNILGMPKEGYAFSNNASSFLGVPGFKDASFYLRRDTTIKIDMKHF